jgi:hypothetical protein
MKFFLFTLIFCSTKAFAQVDDFPYFVFFDNQNNKNLKLEPVEGFLIKKAGDTLYTKIQLGNIINNKEGISYEVKKDYFSFIPLDSITQIRVFKSDTTIFNSKWTDYFVIQDDKKQLRLLRLLRSNKSTIFDDKLDFKNGSNTFGTAFYIRYNDSLVNTYRFWGSSNKRNLIYFYNSRTKSKIKPKDYKKTITIIEKISEI